MLHQHRHVTMESLVIKAVVAAGLLLVPFLPTGWDITVSAVSNLLWLFRA